MEVHHKVRLQRITWNSCLIHFLASATTQVRGSLTSKDLVASLSVNLPFKFEQTVVLGNVSRLTSLSQHTAGQRPRQAVVTNILVYWGSKSQRTINTSLNRISVQLSTVGGHTHSHTVLSLLFCWHFYRMSACVCVHTNSYQWNILIPFRYMTPALCINLLYLLGTTANTQVATATPLLLLLNTQLQPILEQLHQYTRLLLNLSE